MKRQGYIYEKIYDIDNLRLAHQNARKDKLFYKEVKMVDECEEFFLLSIQEMLINKTYKVSDYMVSKINDKGKEREIAKLPYFPDRIIQWAIMLQLESIFMKTFCDFSCASIKGRGIKKATNLTKEYMKDKKNTKYCLKMDINKFYPSINRTILKRMLREKIKDSDLLELLDLIIDSVPGDKGVPIGSYLSQFLANYYLTYFDHWLKETIGVKYIVRYMDDIIIFYRNKKYLHSLKKTIDLYLKQELDLKVKHNYQVFPTNIRGIDFVGFRHFYNFTLLRKNTCKRMKKKSLKILKKQNKNELINYSEWCSINSYNGWLKQCDSYRLRKKYIEPIKPSADRYYKEIIKKGIIKWN